MTSKPTPDITTDPSPDITTIPAAQYHKIIIPAHSPFMPGNAGGCLLALCDEAAPADVVHQAGLCLNAARDIVNLLMMDSAALDGHSGALCGVATLIELAEGLFQGRAELADEAATGARPHSLR